MMEADNWDTSSPHSPQHQHDSDDNNNSNALSTDAYISPDSIGSGRTNHNASMRRNNKTNVGSGGGGGGGGTSTTASSGSSSTSITTSHTALRRPTAFVRTPTNESEDSEMNETFQIPSPPSHRSPLTHRSVMRRDVPGGAGNQSPMSLNRQLQHNRRVHHHRSTTASEKANLKRKKGLIEVVRSCLFVLVLFFLSFIMRQAFWGLNDSNTSDNGNEGQRYGDGSSSGSINSNIYNNYYDTGRNPAGNGRNGGSGGGGVMGEYVMKYAQQESSSTLSNPFKGNILTHGPTSTGANHKMTAPTTGKDSKDTVRLQQLKEASKKATIRYKARSQRTKPPTSSAQQQQEQNGKEHVLEGFEFKLKDTTSEIPQAFKASRTFDENNFDKDTVRADSSTLCGVHAQHASKDHSGSFLKRDVLNSNSRVLITGILNPVGFKLAMKLKEQCGVEIMMGVDPMLPNTVSHRLELQKRIATLTKSIPKLTQPITLPFLGLEPLLKQDKKTKSSHHAKPKLAATGETNLIDKFRPTHVVHLAAYTMEEYHDEDAETFKRTNTDHPYVLGNGQRSEDMLYIRSSLASMEHILNSIASASSDINNVQDKPHLTYASSMGVIPKSTNTSSSKANKIKAPTYDEIFTGVKLSEEILADTYYSMRSVYSVGLRFPTTVYGPWGRSTSPDYRLAEAAVQHWRKNEYPKKETKKRNTGNEVSKTLIQSAGLTNIAHEQHDFLFVDDAVDAIITAMQYRSSKSVPGVFDISSEKLVTFESAAAIITSKLAGQEKSDAEFDLIKAKSPSSERMHEIMKWTPKTKLQEGLVKMVAWHLDKAAPYGLPQEGEYEEDHNKKKDHSITTPAALETGYEFAKRAGVDTCAPDDMVCHGGKKVAPCASECSSKANCIPSIFDDVVQLVSDVSAECDLVLYTDSLGYNVEDIKLTAEYRDDGDPIVCNFAFVPSYSTIVKSILKKVPTEQYKKFGITPKRGESAQSLLERKHKVLNGHLLYKGWITIWVDDALKPLSPADQKLLKLSPGRLFSSTVQHAMYVSENFRVTPSYDDVNFLTHETHRKPLKPRSVYQQEDDGKKHKYKLPAEPERRAILLVSPLKHKLKDDHFDSPSNTKISLHDAVKYMQFEIRGDDASSREMADVRVQREFYERLGQFVNKMDMRSPNEPYHRYTLKHYIRSRWLVHDLVQEDGRLFRCNWYHEHSLWETNFDQLSFAHVMAYLDLERRIANREPDDMDAPEHPMHEELCDAHEWYSLGAGLSLSGDIVEKNSDDIAAVQQETTEEDKDALPETKDQYVRIMSEKYMMESRRQWAMHKKRHKNKK